MNTFIKFLEEEQEDLMLHISFNSDLPRTLKPRQPDGFVKPMGTPSLYYEDLPPRVSFAPSIQQCFFGVYSNIRKYFEGTEEQEVYPYLIMYVYEGLPNIKTKYIPKETLKNKLWDYHITGEIAVTTEIEVTKVSKIKIYNPYLEEEQEEVHGHAYNDTSNERRFIAPIIKYDVIERY